MPSATTRRPGAAEVDDRAGDRAVGRVGRDVGDERAVDLELVDRQRGQARRATRGRCRSRPATARRPARAGPPARRRSGRRRRARDVSVTSKRSALAGTPWRSSAARDDPGQLDVEQVRGREVHRDLDLRARPRATPRRRASASSRTSSASGPIALVCSASGRNAPATAGPRSGAASAPAPRWRRPRRSPGRPSAGAGRPARRAAIAPRSWPASASWSGVWRSPARVVDLDAGAPLLGRVHRDVGALQQARTRRSRARGWCATPIEPSTRSAIPRRSKGSSNTSNSRCGDEQRRGRSPSPAAATITPNSSPPRRASTSRGPSTAAAAARSGAAARRPRRGRACR